MVITELPNLINAKIPRLIQQVTLEEWTLNPSLS